MNCPNCGAAMRLDESKSQLVCNYCTYVHVPEPDADGVRLLGENADVPCPVCRIALTHAVLAGTPVLSCARCRGLLLSMDDFGILVMKLQAGHWRSAPVCEPLEPRDLERRIDCPQCGRRFDTHPYAGPGNIVIDNCPNCRLNWLDHAELRRIVQAPDHQYNDRAWIPPATPPD